jgi:hypothetical protein
MRKRGVLMESNEEKKRNQGRSVTNSPCEKSGERPYAEWVYFELERVLPQRKRHFSAGNH